MKITGREMEFLGLIAIAVDFPCSHLGRFDCSLRNIYKIINKFLEAGYIKKYRKQCLLSLRITQRGLKYLTKENSLRYESDRKYCKSEKSKRIRLNRIAEAYLLLKNAGIIIYKDEKPDLFKSTEIISEADTPQIHSPCFYSSIEIKNQGDEYIKIMGTRAVGVLLIDNSTGFFVYNAGNYLMKWSSKAEYKLDGVMMGTLLEKHIFIKNWSAIMIGSDMEVAWKSLNSEGGYNNNFFKLDNIFNEFYFVPDSANGEMIMKILCDNEIRKAKRESILRRFGAMPLNVPYMNDGQTKDGKAILLAYEFDMEKIKCFRMGIDMFGDEAIVVCYDFQRDVLERYFEGAAEVVVI